MNRLKISINYKTKIPDFSFKLCTIFYFNPFNTVLSSRPAIFWSIGFVKTLITILFSILTYISLETVDLSEFKYRSILFRNSREKGLEKFYRKYKHLLFYNLPTNILKYMTSPPAAHMAWVPQAAHESPSSPYGLSPPAAHMAWVPQQPINHSKAIPLLQFFFVRLWCHIWRLFCHYLFLTSPSFGA